MEHWSKQFALNLAACNTEDAVAAILDTDDARRNLCWKPLGGTNSNFSTINNQQQNSAAALTEKPINSIDAILTKECLLTGIDPCSSDAPATMSAAVERFFKTKGGDLTQLDDRARRELADNIWITAEGGRERPTLTVADRGEGQHPNHFENTFLSLPQQHANKADIPFVQGKYNMGGTGVLRFCGEKGYQLILARRDQRLLRSGQDDEWGATLVRRHEVEGSSYKHGWWEFCTDTNGRILRFPGEPLPVLPEGRSLEVGTYIRMFDYDLENASIITLGLWRELNRLLYVPALPITMYEGRDYVQKAPSKIMLGNQARLRVGDRDAAEGALVEEALTTFASLGRLGERRIDVTVLKADASKSEYTSQNNAVFLTINGQTHATLGRSFLKSKASLYYLADHLVVHIDCSDVPTNVRDRIFMASRDRMAQNEDSREIEDRLAEALQKHEGLRRLERVRQESIVSRNPSDKEFVEDVVSRLIKDNPSLASYLGLTGKVVDHSTRGGTKISEFKGKWIPTFLRIANFSPKDGKTYEKQIPLNSFAVVRLETDACNDYLSRQADPGKLSVSGDVEVRYYSLHDGVIPLALEPSNSAAVGEKETVSVRLTRPYSDPLEVSFEVRYANPQPPGRSGTRTRDKPKGQSYYPPDPTLVYKEKREGSPSWDDMFQLEGRPWTGDDVAKVIPNNGDAGLDGADVFINMDSNSLDRFLLTKKLGPKKRETATRYYQTCIYLQSLVVYNELRDHEERDELLPLIMKGVGKTALDLWQAKEWQSSPDEE